MARKPIWIDTDSGIDDAIALLVAFQLESIDIKGISSVSGNVELSKTFKNNRNIAYLAGNEHIKVYAGADRPLNNDQNLAANIHGENGLGDVEIKNSPVEIETEKAWDKLYEVAKASKGELEIVAVGPLTNIATAIAKYPDIEAYIKRILIMGGAIEGGNKTPAAEFNIYADPHAAEVVFKSNIPKVMFGLDVTLKSVLKVKELKKLREKESSISKFFFEATDRIMKIYNTLGFVDSICLHDVCPVLYLEYPEIFSGECAGVYVETEGEITMGKTVCDLRSDFKFDKRDTLVMLDVDSTKFSKTIERLLLKY